MPLRITSGNDYFYTEEFKVIVRSCKEILQARASSVPIVDIGKKFAYRHNFYKFLREYGAGTITERVAEDMMWVIGFINDIDDPTADFSHLSEIKMITREDLLMITQTNRVQRE